MTNIDQILNNNRIEVEGLLRKHKIAGPLNMDTIRKGYDRKGSPFMMGLMKIITPTSNFEMLPDADVALPADTVNAAIASDAGSNSWTWWDKVLNVVTKTSSALGSVKNSLSQPQIDPNVVVTTIDDQKRTNMLYWIGGGFVLLIIIILLLKK